MTNMRYLKNMCVQTCLSEEARGDRWQPHPDMLEKPVVQHSHTQVDYPVQSAVGTTDGVLAGRRVTLATTLHKAPKHSRFGYKNCKSSQEALNVK